MVAALNREELVYKAVLRGDLEIDEKGRIWRCQVRRGDRWNGKTRLLRYNRRRAEHDNGRYLQVRVMTNLKRIHALAHRLVWFHIHGPIPKGLTVNHKNGKKKDNHPANLELATYSEQAIHALRVLRVGRTDQWGERNSMSKLTTGQVEKIREQRAAGDKLVDIAKDFGVTFQTISRIVRYESRCRG